MSIVKTLLRLLRKKKPCYFAYSVGVVVAVASSFRQGAFVASSSASVVAVVASCSSDSFLRYLRMYKINAMDR